MGTLKKLIAAAVLLMAVVFAMTTLSAMAAEQTNVMTETQVIGDLGILLGDGNGLTDEYLNKPTTRIQAAIMFLRLKGLEADAMAFKGMDNFTDANLVWPGGQTFMAYLKANPQLGWAGIGGGKFDPLTVISSQEFYKVMLEALGYKTGTDFEYANTIAFAGTLGLSRVAAMTQFKNMNIVTASVEVLNSEVKGSGKTLAAILSGLGKLDPSKLAELQYTRLDLQSSATLGNYLVDSKGKTLYYFTKDAADLNSCVGGCLGAWPVFYAEKLLLPAGLKAADFGVNKRADGTEQTTYKGWPLYYFAKDAAAGDTNGDGVNSVWYVIKAPSDIAIGTSATLGNYLTDSNGMTLYYFDKDTMGISNCSGQCLTAWPLFYGEDLALPKGLKAEDFGTIVRADGKEQTTYKGFPLYYWFKDKQRGDTTGQDFGKVWYVVDPVKFSGTQAVNSSVKTNKNDKLGTFLVDSKGKSLYLFTKDVANPNSCTGKCLDAWPVYYDASLTVSSDLNAADFGEFTRADGKKQNTYKGWPLYYFVKDDDPGDTYGENVGKVWFVAKVPFYTVAIGTKADTGNYLVDAKGMALYYFDTDMKGVSSCSGECVTYWPLFYSDSIVVPTGVNASDFGSIKRADGAMQSTYKGYPLYYWLNDKKSGDTTGTAVPKWFLINPDKFAGTTVDPIKP